MEICDSFDGLSIDLVQDTFPNSEGVSPDIAKGGGASISLHAILGSLNPKILCLCGTINQKRVISLVNSNNRHNFVDSKFVKQADMEIYTSKSLEVRVANGTAINCWRSCS